MGGGRISRSSPGNVGASHDGVWRLEKLSMAVRVELTKKYAQAYAVTSKKGRTAILGQVIEVAGWNRDHARQQLVARLK